MWIELWRLGRNGDVSMDETVVLLPRDPAACDELRVPFDDLVMDGFATWLLPGLSLLPSEILLGLCLEHPIAMVDTYV